MIKWLFILVMIAMLNQSTDQKFGMNKPHSDLDWNHSQEFVRENGENVLFHLCPLFSPVCG
jgi:hypothetical protein